MATDTEDFINCAMGALEEGLASTQEIVEECACRLGFAAGDEQTTEHEPKE